MGKHRNKKGHGTELKVMEIDPKMLKHLGIEISDIIRFEAMARGLIRKVKGMLEFYSVRDDTNWGPIEEEFRIKVREQYGEDLRSRDVERIAKQRVIKLRIYWATMLANHYRDLALKRMTFGDQQSRIFELMNLIERLTADLYDTSPMEKPAVVHQQQLPQKGNHAPNQSA